MSSLPFAELAGTAGFQCDPRFTAGLLPSAEPGEPEDLLGRAWDDGHAAGFAEAQTAARQHAESEAATRGRIELALARLDADLAEQLRQKLVATVEALCESCLAPLATDRDALAARVARAAAMLARADDERVLRLHPDDLRLIAERLPQDLEVLEDSSLERGALRIETTGGGVEDGPAHWRRAITEALAQC
jgi:flagellar assembly protein FliH